MTSQRNKNAALTDAEAIEAELLAWVEHSNRERTFVGKVEPAIQWARTTLEDADIPAGDRSRRRLATTPRQRCAVRILSLADEIETQIRDGEAEQAVVNALELATRIEQARQLFARADAATRARREETDAANAERMATIRRYIAANPEQSNHAIARRLARTMDRSVSTLKRLIRVARRGRPV
jgi:hypothetical protein